MKNRIFRLLAFSMVACLIGLASCTKDKALQSTSTIDTSGCIQAGEIITYTGDMMRILDTYCNNASFGSCHQSELNGGTPGLDFTTYGGIKAEADNGQLIARVFNSPGNPMPSIITLGPQELTACDLLKVQAWVDGGAQQ